MNVFQKINLSLKVAKMAFNQTYTDTNKFYKALFSYFNNILYVLPDNFETYITKGYQSNPEVYSVVSFLGRKIASVPFYVYEVRDEKKLKTYQKKSGNFRMDNVILKSKALEEVEGTDLNKLLERPNEMQGLQQFTEGFVSFLLITGNTFTYKLKPESGLLRDKTTKAYLLPSQYVQIIGGGEFQPVEAYKMIIGNQAVTFTYDEVQHTKLFNPYYTYTGDELYGQSPLKAALRTIGSSNEAFTAKYKAFINGGAAGLLYSKDANLPMSIEQIDQVEQMIKQKIKGAENANNIVATNGIVEYKQIGLSPVDLAILDSLNYDRDTICRIYGVDPILFSTDSASYNNKEQASKKLVSDVMVHYLNLYRDFWNEIAKEYSVNGKTYYIDYDLSALPEIQAEYVALISSLKEAYWVTPNEKRIATNFDSDENPNMDKYYFPSNLVALDELTALVDTNLKNYGDYR